MLSKFLCRAVCRALCSQLQMLSKFLCKLPRRSEVTRALQWKWASPAETGLLHTRAYNSSAASYRRDGGLHERSRQLHRWGAHARTDVRGNARTADCASGHSPRTCFTTLLSHTLRAPPAFPSLISQTEYTCNYCHVIYKYNNIFPFTCQV